MPALSGADCELEPDELEPDGAGAEELLPERDWEELPLCPPPPVGRFGRGAASKQQAQGHAQGCGAQECVLFHESCLLCK